MIILFGRCNFNQLQIMSTWKTSNQNYGSHSGRPSSLPSKKIGRSTLEYIEKLDKGDFIHQQ